MRTIKLLVAIFVVLFTASCSTVGPSVHANLDNTIDFNKYKTFGFFEKLDTDHRYESLLSHYLKEATTEEMTKRGFIYKAESPDLLINFYRNVENKQDIHQRPTTRYGAYYGYRGRIYYEAWHGYDSYTVNYKLDTLNIDMVDRQLNKMIWQGTSVDRLSEEKMKNLQATLNKMVADIFSKFPL